MTGAYSTGRERRAVRAVAGRVRGKRVACSQPVSSHPAVGDIVGHADVVVRLRSSSLRCSGLLLALTWLQQRNVRALAWWGAAYLIGASSMALWSAPTPLFKLPPEAAGRADFRRLRHDLERRAAVPWPPALCRSPASAGALVWLVLCQLAGLARRQQWRASSLGAIVVAAYTFFIAFELWRERRKQLHSRAAAVVVPSLHAAIFLMPLGHARIPAGNVRRRLGDRCSRLRP